MYGLWLLCIILVLFWYARVIHDMMKPRHIVQWLLLAKINIFKFVSAQYQCIFLRILPNSRLLKSRCTNVTRLLTRLVIFFKLFKITFTTRKLIVNNYLIVLTWILFAAVVFEKKIDDDSYAPFTPVRQTIRRPLQSSVVRFSQNRSDRKFERSFAPSPSSVVRHPSSVKIGPGAILTDDGWRMRTINHGNELWIGNSPQIIPLSTTFPDCTYLKLSVH